MPENPYPKGSARAKLWDRREADKRKKEKPKKPAPDVSGGDKSKRRDYLDAQIEGRAMRQHTDKANGG